VINPINKSSTASDIPKLEMLAIHSANLSVSAELDSIDGRNNGCWLPRFAIIEVVRLQKASKTSL
jgi:hypothetical protein